MDILPEDSLEKLIILLYGIDGKPFLSKFKFQKAVFLSILSLPDSKNDALENLDIASFYPHKYGPYSEEVEQRKEDLIMGGYLSPIEEGKEILSDKGIKVYKSMVRNLEKNKRKIFVLENIKRTINVPIRDEILALLVYDIAEKYGYTAHSEIVEKLNKNRIKYAIILYKKGIISRERASELARLSPLEFSKILMRIK